jgi:hypothetical protein
MNILYIIHTLHQTQGGCNGQKRNDSEESALQDKLDKMQALKDAQAAL